MNKKTVLSILSMLICTLSALYARPGVLFVHSYHTGQDWAGAVVAGAQNVLGADLAPCEVYYEFMDTKRFSGPGHDKTFLTYLKQKYADTRLDLLMVSDDNAFNLMCNNRNFGNKRLPMVFCGVNDTHAADISPDEDITGVIEVSGIEHTLLLAKKLHPLVDTLVVISDDTVTGQLNNQLLKEIYQQHSPDSLFVTMIETHNLDLSNPKLSLKGFGKGCVGILLGLVHDSKGQVYSFSEASSIISKNAAFPLYSAWDFYLNHGIVGGCLVSGRQQGRLGAKLALQVLAGKPAGKIPVQASNVNNYMFDQLQLDRWDIDTDLLPANSYIINRENSFYVKNRRRLSLFAALFFTLSGAFVLLLVSFSVRRKAHRELVLSQSYLKGLIDSMPSLLVTVNHDGRIRNCNAQFERFARISNSRAVGRRLEQVFPQPELEDYTRLVMEAIKNQQVLKREKQQINYRGKSFVVNLTVYPLLKGLWDSAVIRIDDVSAQAKMEEIMVETEKMISIGGLAGGIAHEINNPIGGVVQGVQNLARRLDTTFAKNQEAAQRHGLDLNALKGYLEERQVLQYLQGIKQSGERAAAIVHNMLDFARNKSSNQQKADLTLLVENSINLAAGDYFLRKQSDIAKVNFVRQFDQNLPHIVCNPIEIEQVLLNLIKNAAQAMAEAATPNPIITIRLFNLEDQIRIELEDNGPGIPRSAYKHIFLPFFTTRATKGGSGIGLAVCHHIIANNHRGQISAQDTGHGTRFIMNLPLE